jgi:hypothetical protein
MRWIVYILLSLLVLQSCEEEKSEVSFRIKMDGFSMKDDTGFPQQAYPSFKHKYSAGLISFVRDQQSQTFYFGEGKIEDYLFKLPPGEYNLDANIQAASLYGQASASFQVESERVSITELTDTITIRAEANCSLILVSDELEQLDEGPFIIERHSYANGSFKSYPLARDSTSGLYYTYFTPDFVLADPSAFLWFYGEWSGVEKGGMSTSRFEVGYLYFISILE